MRQQAPERLTVTLARVGRLSSCPLFKSILLHPPYSRVSDPIASGVSCLRSSACTQQVQVIEQLPRSRFLYAAMSNSSKRRENAPKSPTSTKAPAGIRRAHSGGPQKLEYVTL